MTFFQKQNRRLMFMLAIIVNISSQAVAGEKNNNTDAKTSALIRKMQSDPTTLEALRLNFKGAAIVTARMERLVHIGQLCRTISPDDANSILLNIRLQIESDRALLPDGDQEWSKTYLEGVRAGASQTVELPSINDPKTCEDFNSPDGPVGKIMSWKPPTEKPRTPDK